MAAEMMLVKPISQFASPKLTNSRTCLTSRRFSTVIRMSATSTPPPPATATSKSKKGTKKEINESLLTPRFYTTDFEEMEQLFNTEINKNLNEEEFIALLQEFKTDYNQTHFVRNKEFKEAADKLQGPLRQIFVEFLERSCTAEFSGFLLYKELGRRLKKTNPVVAEIFSLMSRDEARHAGFLNKGLSDFNLALDLGFLTKARKYTFFKPKFIFYATYLSEKIGYWRYITIYRHLKQNPEFQCYPIFKYFENWCQDENRHGDFFSALMKAQPQFLNDWQAKLWSRFFCLSRNYRFFFMFISTSTTLCIYVFVFSWLNIFQRHMDERISIWKAISKDILSDILIVYCFITVWFVGGLTIFHSYLICTNQTTYENFRYRYDKKENPYNRGVLGNIWEIFLSKVPPSMNKFRSFVKEEDYMMVETPTSNPGQNLVTSKEKTDIEMGGGRVVEEDRKSYSLPELLRNLNYEDLEDDCEEDDLKAKDHHQNEGILPSFDPFLTSESGVNKDEENGQKLRGSSSDYDDGDAGKHARVSIDSQEKVEGYDQKWSPGSMNTNAKSEDGTSSPQSTSPMLRR